MTRWTAAVSPLLQLESGEPVIWLATAQPTMLVSKGKSKTKHNKRRGESVHAETHEVVGMDRAAFQGPCHAHLTRNMRIADVYAATLL